MNQDFEVERQGRGRAGGPAARWAVAAVLGAVLVTAAACSSGSASPATTSGNHYSASLDDRGRVDDLEHLFVVVDVAQQASAGPILVNHAGLTLYRYTPDGTGKSVCNGARDRVAAAHRPCRHDKGDRSVRHRERIARDHHPLGRQLAGHLQGDAALHLHR